MALLLVAGGAVRGEKQEIAPPELTWQEAVARGDRILLDQEPPTQAEAHYRQALGLMKAESEATAAAESLILDRLGQALAAQGKQDQAELSFLRSLRWRIAGSGHHAATAETLENLAAVYYEMGKGDEGFAAFEQSHRLRVEIFGENSVQAARSFSLLAAAHHLQGDLVQAEALYRRAVANLRPHANDPCARDQLMLALVNLSLVLKEKRGDEEAAVLEADVLEKEGLGLLSSPECPPSLGESPWGRSSGS